MTVIFWFSVCYCILIAVIFPIGISVKAFNKPCIVGRMNSLKMKAFGHETTGNSDMNMNTPNFLILPGFGNDEADYSKLVENLSRKGITAEVVPIKRLSWLWMLKSIFSPEFYANACTPNSMFDFYFRLTKSKIEEIKEDSSAPLVLLCHSAGGWLARSLLGNGYWFETDLPVENLISGVVTLGTPHLAPLHPFPDVTRGALKFVNDQFPGSHLSDKIFYMSVMGLSVTASSTAPNSSPEKFAYDSYSMVLGMLSKDEDFIGDGVVPLSAGHLKGALQITIDGVYHGVIAPASAAPAPAASNGILNAVKVNKWYGDEDVIDQWLPSVLNLYNSKSLLVSSSDNSQTLNN